MLVAVGIFSLAAGPDAIETIIEKVGTVAPGEVLTLLEDSLQRTVEGGGSLTMTIIGGVLALWQCLGR